MSSCKCFIAELVQQTYGIQLPDGGFDVGGWEMLFDSVFPAIQESPMLADFMLRHAPEGVTGEHLTILIAAGAAVNRALPSYCERAQSEASDQAASG